MTARTLLLLLLLFNDHLSNTLVRGKCQNNYISHWDSKRQSSIIIIMIITVHEVDIRSQYRRV